ncbi:MAG TPA: DUF5011 domain-containing protein [bacterium]|nr:DUF5011 domain-containing protein [bacterium]
MIEIVDKIKKTKHIYFTGIVLKIFLVVLVLNGVFLLIDTVKATSFSVPECSFEEQQGRTIVEFDNNKVRSDKSEEDSYSGPMPTSISPGIYKVSLFSYDGYCDRKNTIQPNESWFVGLSNTIDISNLIAQSSYIDDLEDGVNEASKIQIVNETLEITEQANYVTAFSSVYPDETSANSVYPVCAAFDFIEPLPAITGSISVCKVIVDEEYNITDGSDVIDNTFELAGLNIEEHNTVPVSTGIIPTSVFTTPLTLNSDVLYNDGINDAQCFVYENLELGSYFYDQETIPENGWLTPLYDDQHSEDLNDFYEYSGELFNSDESDDGQRDIRADGHIILTENRPNRTLVLLNQYNENSIPEITLIGNSLITLKQDDAFTDDGATASDEEDGDITDDIVVGGDVVDTSVIGTYIITYNVSDSQGANADEKTRTVEVEEKEEFIACSDFIDNDGDESIDSEDSACHTDGDSNNPDSYDPDIDDENSIPEITLIGNSLITLKQDDAFTDDGATASDEEDGDITDDIVVGGDVVDTSVLGTYIITYNVSDSQGANAEEKTRTVEVEEKNGGGGGGSKTPLIISNEKVEYSDSNTALVTWDTNLRAISMVFYDIASYETSTLPLDEYEFSIGPVLTYETKHSIEIPGLEDNIDYYFRPVASRANEEVAGIELSIISPEIIEVPEVLKTPETPELCQEYILEFIKFGEDNNPEEVTKLQTFLRDFEGFKDLKITGIYDKQTFEAVSAFQEKYADKALSPWGINASTGYVYITTKKTINEIYCQREFLLTIAEKEEIEGYKTFIEGLQEEEIKEASKEIGMIEESPEEKTEIAVLTESGEVEKKEEKKEERKGFLSAGLASISLIRDFSLDDNISSSTFIFLILYFIISLPLLIYLLSKRKKFK